MSSDPIISRKWALTAHGQRNVFVWGAQERSVHTLMKAFLWALYLPAYPHLSIEIRIGDRYKPDVVAMPEAPAVYSATVEPLFWGESGQVGKEKITSLVRRYRHTHFAIAKWNTALHPLEELVRGAVKGVKRTAPFDLLNFPPDSIERFIDKTDTIHITHDHLEWTRLQ